MADSDDLVSLTNDDFSDHDEQPWFPELDWSVLSDPLVIRLVAGLVIALTILVWPGRTDEILVRLIGAGLFVGSAASLTNPLRGRHLGLDGFALAVAGMVLGTYFFALPGRSIGTVGRLLAIGLFVMAGRELLAAWRGRRAEPPVVGWPLLKAAALASAGLMLALFADELLVTVTVIAALSWAIVAFLAVLQSLRADTAGVTNYDDTTRIIVAWLQDRPKAADDRQALYAKILYEGPDAQRRVLRFGTLMAFASVIAAMGVITDSTAVVIGAMLIAPLMTPIMAMAMSLVMGWPLRLARAALVALGGIGIAVGLSLLVGLVVPTTIDVANNAQITSRITPTTLDLIIALAAGAAGAFGLSRPDVSDSLPGVAIAISLVPPLAVVGICYSVGAWAAGNGALLLFGTNALAILVAGGLTFVITGVTPIERLTANQHRMRTSAAALGVLGALVVGSLFLNSATITRNAIDQKAAEDAVRQWISEAERFSAVDTRLDGDRVEVIVAGPGRPPSVDTLANSLADELGRTVFVEVRSIPQVVLQATGST